MGLIEEIRAIYDNYGFDTKILAASIRSVTHVRDVALAGEVTHVDAAASTTLPVTVEDSASLQVVAVGGAIGSLNCSWVTPVREAEVRIYGTEGEAVIDYARSLLHL